MGFGEGLVSELGVHGQSLAHDFSALGDLALSAGFGFMVRVWVMDSAAHGHEDVLVLGLMVRVLVLGLASHGHVGL